MSLKAHWKKHTLNFRFEAGTSRGVLHTKDTWYIFIFDTINSSIMGIGECGPLKGLSPDDRPDFEKKLEEICTTISKDGLASTEIQFLLLQFSLQEYPSILFGLETAILDFQNGGKRIIVDSSFAKGKTAIPINGLVWMGDEGFMNAQLDEKMQQGYNCIKLKIGAIDFDKELKLIEKIRKKFTPEQMTIRLDANGAFSFSEAKEKLKILSSYTIHSIEQPIKAGQLMEMKKLCATTPIPIALDEEIIGIKSIQEKREILENILPQYIILKPTLVGGMVMSTEWINLANTLNIGWWITSALESNIGLNAISQYTASMNVSMPQGLGTGQLYHNNIDSPLTIENGQLYYMPEKKWDLSIF